MTADREVLREQYLAAIEESTSKTA